MSYEASTMAYNMQLPYTTDQTPISPTYNNPNAAAVEDDSMAVVAAGVNGSSGVVKRKRGRPRKYAPEASGSPAAGGASGFSSPALSSVKKPRGRPPGSLNKQHPAASGSPGVGFMPHILDVKPGEDVLVNMMWFSQNSTRALCVLSANGAVSNVTLRQSATSGGTVTYEVIVGSFVPASQKQTRTGVAANNEAEVVNAPHSESSGGGLGSPFDHSNTISNPQAMANMTWR